MNIPQFPESRVITIEDKPIFDEAFSKYPQYLSAYSFTNIFAWRTALNWQVSRLEDALIVHFDLPDTGKFCFEPIGTNNIIACIDEAIKRMNGNKVTFRRLHVNLAHELKANHKYHLHKDRDHADYLYLASDLIELPGRKYSSKRNFINRFKSNYEYEYIKLNSKTAMECHDFIERWCEAKICDSDDSLAHEKCAVFQMLEHFDELKIFGGVIAIKGEIVALALGERFNADTMVVHVEKGNSEIQGIYQLINNEFCINEAEEYKYVNREQDLGVPGLRKAKESYKPVTLIETYNMEIK